MSYRMVPVDEVTYQRLLGLCRAYEMGQRGQGAMVRKLVNAEHEKLADAKLLVRDEVPESKKTTSKKPRIRST